jgi:hypothetical protein
MASWKRRSADLGVGQRRGGGRGLAWALEGTSGEFGRSAGQHYCSKLPVSRHNPQAGLLTEWLSERSPDEIVAFSRIVERLMARSYGWLDQDRASAMVTS